LFVVATAGHVDHGKSTLVRALTGMEPDRWAEEHRRGMTLDLGFVWTVLPSGSEMAFVDVPGHEKFVPTMLAGVGPVPAAMVVVGADSGWQEQTTEHVAILDALGVRYGVLAVTRSDLADPRPALAYARERLARTSLGTVEAVSVSAVTGTGMAELRAALERLAASLPPPDLESRVRLFIDRAFTIKGSGTVVTGTLGAGRLAAGDTVEIFPSGRTARIRELQSLRRSHPAVPAIARVAVNLRGVSVGEVSRGGALLSPAAWVLTQEFDARLDCLDPADIPGDLVFHLGSAAVPCRIRPLGEDTGRVRTAYPLPLQPGDRGVLREPSRRLVAGLHVLDIDPPSLRRRGAARRRGAELATVSDRPDLRAEIARRGAVTAARLVALGVLGRGEPLPDDVLKVGDFLVDPAAWERWRSQLDIAVEEHHRSRPLEAGVSAEAARQALEVPDLTLMDALVTAAEGRLAAARGRIFRPGSGPAFSHDVQASLDKVAARLDAHHFGAPDAPELEMLGLTNKILAAASRLGLFLRLPGDILLNPVAVDEACELLARLPQPFTIADARQALGVTRRIALPLLEHLDSLGRTVRVDSARRQVCGS
jgi:selenocysteine-specific elongation factor